MRRNRSDLCQCLLQTAIRSSASSMPIERRTCPSQILEAYLPPQCHVEVTPGRGVPDKISIVCLTGAAHYILSSNMPQVFLLRALPPVSYAITAKATGFVRYRWLLFFYRKRLHQTAERTARRLFFDPLRRISCVFSHIHI